MNQKETPLYDSLINHSKKQPVSFHVPGHKNGLIFNDHEHVFNELLKIDVTELSGLDDLHSPEGVILQAERLLADLYQVKKSYFLVNGSTVGNLAMILSSFREGDYVIVQRNSHKSIIHALMLAKVKPIFISPIIDNLRETAGELLEDDIYKTIEQYPNVKGIILTYPNYYGKTFCLKEIIQYAHKKKIPVLVDEAHGAHFIIGEPFPSSSIKLGADIVVQSAHKTLPAMTMGSYLHFNSEILDENKVTNYLSIFQSSSPSYPIMASLDLARSFLGTFHQEDKEYTIQKINDFIKSLKSIHDITVIEDDERDPLKITIQHQHISGFQFQKALENEGIYPEMADPRNVLLVAPLLKVNQTYPFDSVVKKIRAAVENIVKIEWPIPNFFSSIEENRVSALKYTYKDLEMYKKEFIHIDNAEGKISAESIIPYPPGIPLMMIGEEISMEKIEQMKNLINSGARFHGGKQLSEKQIEVYIF